VKSQAQLISGRERGSRIGPKKSDAGSWGGHVARFNILHLGSREKRDQGTELKKKRGKPRVGLGVQNIPKKGFLIRGCGPGSGKKKKSHLLNWKKRQRECTAPRRNRRRHKNRRQSRDRREGRKNGNICWWGSKRPLTFKAARKIKTKLAKKLKKEKESTGITVIQHQGGKNRQEMQRLLRGGGGEVAASQ